MHALTDLIKDYGLAAIFLNVLLECFGLPVPAYPLLIVAAALAVSGGVPLWAILVTAVAASLIADFVWYYSGKRYNTRVLGFLCKISLSPDSCVKKTRDLFSKLGPAALTFTKFIPGFSCIAIVLAGATKVRAWMFALLDGIGAILYVSVALMLGVMFRDVIDSTLNVMAEAGRWSVIAIVGVLAAYIAWRAWQRHQFLKQLRMDRITVNELQELMARGTAPVILDTRLREVRDFEGHIPGSIFVGPALMNVDGIPRDAEVVVFCACPNDASAVIGARKLKEAGFKKIRPLQGGIDAWVDAGHAIERAQSEGHLNPMLAA
jgi:membrane protein DedA with SNARE-associated domain/rhodanese-related sulfurtransferase